MAKKTGTGQGRKIKKEGLPLRVTLLKSLFDFLFQMIENIWCKELDNRNIQTITQFLNSCYCRAVVSTADNVVDGRLRDAAHGAQFIYCDVPLRT